MNLSKSIYLAAAACSSMLLWSCSETEPIPDGACSAEDDGEISITLRIPADASLTSTRALPTGGEDGDGREAALPAENALKDANIFFFIGSGFNPVTRDPAQIPVTCVYVDDLSPFIAQDDIDPFEKKVIVKVKTSDTKLEENGLLTSSDVGFITVVNAGRNLSEIGNLEALRQFSDFGQSWTLTGNTYSDFLMTTAYDVKTDGNITIGGLSRYVGNNRLQKVKSATTADGVEWTGETTVQRVCARIDLAYGDANVGDDELIYSTSAGNKVHITSIRPVNFMRNPSYLLTKTTSDIPASWTEGGIGTPTWGGLQKTLPGNDRPANYIIEPTTIAKASGTKKLSEWYGTSAATTVLSELPDQSKGKAGSYWAGTLQKPESNGCNRISIIGYSNENILSPSCYTSDFITGLAFRALFQPSKICIKKGDTFLLTELSDTQWKGMADKTVWRYQPSAGREGIKESDALWFISESDLKDYCNSNTADLATVTRFTDGVCYYNLWLRHYNDESYLGSDADPKAAWPMEFAIVRNNIYRVALTFTGPGEPSPTLREPDTMMSRIFVRKWNRRDEKDPLQF